MNTGKYINIHGQAHIQNKLNTGQILYWKQV